MKHAFRGNGIVYGIHCSRHGDFFACTQGATLVELLVSITIVSILLSLAVPAFDAAMTSSKLTAATNSMFASLYLARGEAIKRNARVVICKSADGANCTATGNWDQGWIVFHDSDNNAQLDTGETLVHRQEPLGEDMAMWGNTPVVRYVSYTGIGAAKLTSGAFQAGTITLCRTSDGESDARDIVISSTGRPRVYKSTLASCP
jgi:type IV fimbrial biogenesis protein FimT